MRLYFIFDRKGFLMRKKAACFDKNILNIFATAVATGYNVTMENVRTGSCERRMRTISNIFLHKGAFNGFQNGALRQRTRRREFPQKPNLIFPHGFSRRIILCRQQTVCRAFQAARSGSFSSFWVIRTSSLSAAAIPRKSASRRKRSAQLPMSCSEINPIFCFSTVRPKAICRCAAHISTAFFPTAGCTASLTMFFR